MELPALPPLASWAALVERALAEDLGPGDLTSQVCIDASARGPARIEARQPLVVCGVPVAAEVFRQVDPEVELRIELGDGDEAQPGDRIISLDGSVRSTLTAERTALNFLTRLCGVASLTRRYVEAVVGTRAAIVDTRKTLPGWRTLDKYAVAVGGGTNHRMGLFDGILLKDNHIAASGGIEAAVKSALASAPANVRVQVEVQSEAEALAACDSGADFLLLDNLAPDAVRSIVERLAGRAVLEASGGIGLSNVRAYAETGVHRISIGALTHSALGSDVALEMDVDG